MGELLQLDAAAKSVGKSEVTLRRLVKSGKVQAHKEKTLTGFLYKVDSEEILEYYHLKEAALADVSEEPKPVVQEPVPTEQPEQEKETRPMPGHAIASNGKIRIAVANESGNSAEYWLKRAEIYEDRYHKELHRSGEMREELGIWRGRAEHAQAMLLKMLPAPTTIEVSAHTAKGASEKTSSNSWAYAVLFSIVFIVLAGMVVYVITVK